MELSAAENADGHHWWVHSCNGFQSQTSSWISLPLGSGKQRELQVTWPRGHVSRHTVSAWTREVLLEPEAATPSQSCVPGRQRITLRTSRSRRRTPSSSNGSQKLESKTSEDHLVLSFSIEDKVLHRPSRCTELRF